MRASSVLLGHRLEGVLPAAAWVSGGGDDKGAVFEPDFDIVAQASLLDQRLGDANTLRIADANESGMDGVWHAYLRGVAKSPVECRYIVIPGTGVVNAHLIAVGYGVPRRRAGSISARMVRAAVERRAGR